MQTDEVFEDVVAEVSVYLDAVQRKDQLWNQVDGHLSMAYVAECLGETELVPRHLNAVNQLLGEIFALPSPC